VDIIIWDGICGEVAVELCSFGYHVVRGVSSC
jgi:hypothetical protein